MYNRDIAENAMGYGGFEFISDTAVHNAPTNMTFCTLQTLTITTFTAINPVPSGNTFTGVAIPAGTIINGQFLSVTLTSGSLIAYKGV